MWVAPELLSSGGEVARSAGQRVLGGAAALSQAPIGSSIFGDFDAARAFHQRLSQHRTGQVNKMRDNHQTPTGVGDKAQTSSGWMSGLFVGLAAVFVLVLVAFRFTTHIKIGHKIYAFMHENRPDPPPALGPDRYR